MRLVDPRRPVARSTTRARFACVAAVAAAALLVPSRADAYRPFDGTDADVAELHVFELELGPVHYLRRGPDLDSLIAPALVLNYGIFEKTELVVDAEQSISLFRPLPGTGGSPALVDDDILVKHVFREGILQEKTGVSVAAEAGVLTPEVNAGDTSFGASLDVITSYRWSWGTLHYNEWFEYTREHHADLFTGVILEGPFDWAVRPVSELFFDKDFAAGQTESVLLGAIWTVTESIALDAGYRHAWLGTADYVNEVRLGLTWSVVVGKADAEPAAHAGLRKARVPM